MDYTPTTEELREMYKWAPNDEARHEGFDRWLAARDAARDREVAARAWDEGAQHVYAEGRCLFAQDGDPCPANPYREPNA